MRTHLQAIEALLVDAPTYFTSVPDPLPSTPYYIITAPTFMSDPLTLGDTTGTVDDYFQVTAVGADDEQCRWAQERAVARLDRKSVTPTGWHGWVRRRNSGAVNADRSVKLTSGAHPHTATDLYHYTATASDITGS